MRGDGTKLDITTHNPPPARLLDITRLISRAGRRMTGIDRVELACLRRLLDEPVPLFAVARTTLGYILLDGEGARRMAARLSGAEDWGLADLFTALARNKPETVKRAESDLRRFALSRCPSGLLARMLARHVPQGTAYLNTGHTNITERVMRAVRDHLRGRITIFLHDTIPLDFPQYQRPEVPARFAALLRRVQRYADLVICNSDETRNGLSRHAAADAPLPETVVAHLGVDPPRPDPSELPDGLDLDAPYFVTLGTIEPRKRHDLLLDVWEAMEQDNGPKLFICGARGWENDAVFRRLDQYPPDGPVRELSDLTDGAVAALLQNARALLFPSDAEGFGLPPAEAAALGTTVVCQDLPVFREVLGDNAVYAGGSDRYLWQNIIERLIHDQDRGAKAVNEQGFMPPSWENHFNIVLKLT